MRFVVTNYPMGGTEAEDYVLLQKFVNNLIVICPCWYRFDPFLHIVNYNQDVPVAK